MDIARIKAQLFFAISDLRDFDANAVLDMFLLEHKLLGRMTEVRLSTVDYVSATQSLLLPTNVLTVNEVYYNDSKLKNLSRDDLSESFELGYSLGEDGVLYLNFDIVKDTSTLVLSTDILKVYAKVSLDDIADYEDKWLPVCVKYCLKELYKSKTYRDAEQYAIAVNDYNTIKRIVGGLNRNKLRMNFMEDRL
jgi:hypothetical protein